MPPEDAPEQEELSQEIEVEGPDPRQWPEGIRVLIADLKAVQELLPMVRLGPATNKAYQLGISFLESQEQQLKVEIVLAILTAYGVPFPVPE